MGEHGQLVCAPSRRVQIGQSESSFLSRLRDLRCLVRTDFAIFADGQLSQLSFRFHPFVFTSLRAQLLRPLEARLECRHSLSILCVRVRFSLSLSLSLSLFFCPREASSRLLFK